MNFDAVKNSLVREARAAGLEEYEIYFMESGGTSAETLKGEISSPIDPPDECRFAKRCIYACDGCRKKTPELVEVSPGHFVACPYYNKLNTMGE